MLWHSFLIFFICSAVFTVPSAGVVRGSAKGPRFLGKLPNIISSINGPTRCWKFASASLFLKGGEGIWETEWDYKWYLKTKGKRWLKEDGLEDLNIFYLICYFMVVKHCSGVPRLVVEPPSLEIFKTLLAIALSTLLWFVLRKVLEQMASRGSCHVILWLCHFDISFYFPRRKNELGEQNSKVRKSFLSCPIALIPFNLSNGCQPCQYEQSY